MPPGNRGGKRPPGLPGRRFPQTEVYGSCSGSGRFRPSRGCEDRAARALSRKGRSRAASKGTDAILEIPRRFAVSSGARPCHVKHSWGSEGFDRLRPRHRGRRIAALLCSPVTGQVQASCSAIAVPALRTRRRLDMSNRCATRPERRTKRTARVRTHLERGKCAPKRAHESFTPSFRIADFRALAVRAEIRHASTAGLNASSIQMPPDSFLGDA